MSVYLLNPTSLHGEPGDPPEYASTEPVQCVRCSVELDAEEDRVHETVTTVERGRKLRVPRYELVCEECIECCPCCGEYLDAANAERFGPAVSVRLWENNGRREVHHAVCAADWLMGCWCDEPGLFESEKLTREEIAEALHAARGTGSRK